MIYTNKNIDDEDPLLQSALDSLPDELSHRNKCVYYWCWLRPVPLRISVVARKVGTYPSNINAILSRAFQVMDGREYRSSYRSDPGWRARHLYRYINRLMRRTARNGRPVVVRDWMFVDKRKHVPNKPRAMTDQEVVAGLLDGLHKLRLVDEVWQPGKRATSKQEQFDQSMAH